MDKSSKSKIIVYSCAAVGAAVIIWHLRKRRQSEDVEEKTFEAEMTNENSNPRDGIIEEEAVEGTFDVRVLKSKTFDPPPGFEAAAFYKISSRFGNIDGGYYLKSVDSDGYGQYFDEEDKKWLFYMYDYEKWFVADELKSTMAFLVSKETSAKDPAQAGWEAGVEVASVDVDSTAQHVYDESQVGADETFVDAEFAPGPASVGPEHEGKCCWVRAVAIRGPGVTPKLFDKARALNTHQRMN